MIPKLLRLISLFLTLTFASEQILFAFPGEGSFGFSSPIQGYGGALQREERSVISTHFSSPQNPYIGDFPGLPKTSSLKQAGWFKKLFHKIAKFFQKVVQAITKAIQKVVSFIAKAVGAVFGKAIGNFVGKLAGGLLSLAASPVLFFAQTAAYAFSGDVKGLFKYWGSMAIQIAVTALMFIPGVGQVLYGVLNFLLQPLLAIGKFLIGGILQGLGVAFSGMGSFFGGFSTGIGSLFSGVGVALRSLGQSLVQSAKTFFNSGIKDIFAKLKSDTFSFQKAFSEFKRGILNQINPVTYYQNLFQSVTQTLHNLTHQTGISKLLGLTMEKLSIQIAQQQIDKSLEKSKMNAFLQSFLSTVSSAGLQAMGQAATEDLFPSSSSPLEATGSRAPPTGLSGFFERIQSALSSVSGLVTDALKDASGFIKSIFIRDSGKLPSNAGIEILQGPAQEIEFDSDHNPITLKILDPGQSEVRYTLEDLGKGNYRADLGEGDYQFFKIDPATQQVLSNERIGNLETNPSFFDGLQQRLSDFNESRLLFADALDLGIDNGIDSLIGSPQGLPSWAYISSYTALHTAGDLVKGIFSDPLRIGNDIPDIISSFKEGFRQGELGQALKNYLFGGMPLSSDTPNLNRAAALSLNEIGRGFIVGGTVKELVTGALARAGESGLLRNLSETLADERGFARIGNGIRGGPKTSDGIQFSKLGTETRDLRGEVEQLKQAYDARLNELKTETRTPWIPPQIANQTPQPKSPFSKTLFIIVKILELIKKLQGG